MKYAGIGSRQTPEVILKNHFEIIGEQYGTAGHVLRSGRAKGADLAFEAGCDMAQGDKEIFLAQEFVKRYDYESKTHGYDPDMWALAFELAEKYHPNWRACNGFARKLHARNGFIVLGERLNDPVDFIVCWTEDGKLKGGTAQALSIAHDYDIEVVNYGDVQDSRA